jgi:hypothetical protein
MEVSKRPKKRKKGNTYHSFASHPLNVLPLGNLYTGSTNCRIDSLGLFSSLQDDTIVEILGYFKFQFL